MSKADQIFIQNCTDIMENGFWDTELEVRPKWLDGTPAHTVKKFCIVNRYDLREEFPILTTKQLYIRQAVLEMLWIYQAQSNDVRWLQERGVHIWDEWEKVNAPFFSILLLCQIPKPQYEMHLYKKYYREFICFSRNVYKCIWFINY